MVTTERRYVMADLLEFPDDDDRFYDIVGGKLIMYNVPDLDHGLVASDRAGLLCGAGRAGYGIALTNAHAVEPSALPTSATASPITGRSIWTTAPSSNTPSWASLTRAATMVSLWCSERTMR
jgi:hypothetical protein